MNQQCCLFNPFSMVGRIINTSLIGFFDTSVPFLGFLVRIEHVGRRGFLLGSIIASAAITKQLIESISVDAGVTGH